MKLAVNQMFPSGPVVMPYGPLLPRGIKYSVMTPAVVTFAILGP
jgi:hypothetical protein